ncbi:barstar family protein [bacterium]|nr:barstar family protein [bacterium]
MTDQNLPKDEKMMDQMRSLVQALQQSKFKRIFLPEAAACFEHPTTLQYILKEEFDYGMVWIDRHRTISSLQTLFEAYDASLRLYWFGRKDLHWDRLIDELRDTLPAEGKGCVFLFSDLEEFRKQDPENFNYNRAMLKSLSIELDSEGGFQLLTVFNTYE